MFFKPLTPGARLSYELFKRLITYIDNPFAVWIFLQGEASLQVNASKLFSGATLYKLPGVGKVDSPILAAQSQVHNRPKQAYPHHRRENGKGSFARLFRKHAKRGGFDPETCHLSIDKPGPARQEGITVL